MPVPQLQQNYPDYSNVLAKGAAIKGQEAQNVLTQMKIQDYPEDRNWLKKQRERELEDRTTAEKRTVEDRKIAAAKEAREIKEHLSEMDTAAIKKGKDRIEQTMKWFATVENVSDYARFRQGMIEKGGVPPERFEDPANFIKADGTPDEEAFDKYRDRMLMTAKDRVELFREAMKKKELIPVTSGTRLVDPETGEVKLEAKYKPGADKPGINYLLKDRSTVISFDGGRTYKNEAGKNVKMPFDAVRISATVTGQELSMIEAQKQAEHQLGEITPIGTRDVGEAGTGPYSALAAGFDAIAGGFGLDRLLGQEGFFKDITEARQTLRTIKQMGKPALMNSSRGPIYEQKVIDKLFPDPDKFVSNPRTEARKFQVLRKTLLMEKRFNTEAIQQAVTPKEVNELRKSTLAIDRLLALIGMGEGQSEDVLAGGGPQIGAVEDGYTFKGGDPADPKSWEKVK